MKRRLVRPALVGPRVRRNDAAHTFRATQRAASMMGPLRSNSGVVVVARLPTPETAIIDLRPGDVIHEVNAGTVSSVESLRNALAAFRSGDPVALLLERAGQGFYIAFTLP